MPISQTTSRPASRRHGVALCLIAVSTFVLSACVIESPTIEPAAELPTSTVPLPTVQAPSFEPTAAPAPTETPTAPPTPTAAPPAATPEPGIEPLETIIPSLEMVPTLTEAGPVVVPVAGAITFALEQARPILQLPGHTLIYIDDAQQAEVDIFTPVATGIEASLDDYASVIDELLTNPTYADLAELEPVTIAGFPTRVFEGNPRTGERGFYADTSTFGNENAGWYPPVRLRMWLIDTDTGPVAVTAESLVEPGQYNEAVRMAAGLLADISFI